MIHILAKSQQTSRAELDDTSAVKQEQSYVSAQQLNARSDMAKANNIVASTAAIEERVAQLTPVVGNLRAAYLQVFQVLCAQANARTHTHTHAHTHTHTHTHTTHT